MGVHPTMAVAGVGPEMCGDDMFLHGPQLYTAVDDDYLIDDCRELDKRRVARCSPPIDRAVIILDRMRLNRATP